MREFLRAQLRLESGSFNLRKFLCQWLHGEAQEEGNGEHEALRGGLDPGQQDGDTHSGERWPS